LRRLAGTLDEGGGEEEVVSVGFSFEAIERVERRIGRTSGQTMGTQDTDTWVEEAVRGSSTVQDAGESGEQIGGPAEQVMTG
jgi:osmotically-inducible protein OsmY